MIFVHWVLRECNHDVSIWIITEHIPLLNSESREGRDREGKKCNPHFGNYRTYSKSVLGKLIAAIINYRINSHLDNSNLAMS